jgi:hypothetical protein
MADQDLYEFLAKMRDSFNGLALALDEFIQKESKVVLKEYDTEKIQWVEAEGQHGKYQKTDDADNPEYKALRKDLAEHKEKLQHKGSFYWVFQNGVTIGRKPQHGK